jgi:hypothetical protein
MTEAERAQIEAEVLEVAETMVDGFMQLDGELIATTAHPDLVFAYGGHVLNRDTYREAMVAWPEGKESWEGGWVETDVRVLSPDLAVFSGTMEFTVRYSDGRTLHFPNGAFAALYERTSEGWRWSVGGVSSGGGQPVDET